MKFRKIKKGEHIEIVEEHSNTGIFIYPKIVKDSKVKALEKK